MPNTNPLNELERCFQRAVRSKSAVPDFFRQLLISPIWYLLPYHPEMVGQMQVTNGDNFALSMWTNPASGKVVPLFTAEERVFECLKNVGRENEPTCVGMVIGQLIVHILGTELLQGVLNPACCTGELTLFPEDMKELMEGSFLNPIHKDAPSKKVEFIIMDPSEYPTDLIQPLFEYMRQHPAFRAAWIFKQAGEPETSRDHYHLVPN